MHKQQGSVRSLSKHPIESIYEVQPSPDDRKFLHYFYHAPDGIIIYDDARIIHYVNQKITKILGFGYSEILGKPIESFFPQDHLAQTPLLHRLNGDSFSQIRDRVLVKKKGTLVELESSEQHLPDNYYIMILRDNRVRRRSQDEFHKAIKSDIYEKLFIKLRLFMHGEGMLMNLNRLTLFLDNTASLSDPQILNRFIDVTEEYRKIVYPELHSIGRYLHALRIDDDGSQSNGIVLPEGYSIIEYADKLKTIFDNASRMFGNQNYSDCITGIVRHKNDIQTMIDTVKKIIKSTSRDIERFFICTPDDIIGATVKKYRYEENRVIFNLTGNLDGQSAIMNSSELAEVTEILIDNAIESLRDYADGREDFDPWIDITLSIVNDKIRIEIKDNGPGIKKEHQTLLFKDGFTTKGPGHGFGLSYSARYTQRYGGNLSYKSHPGFGACFVIELLRAYHNER
jgi:PAS domain S-box-containing protein